jgi:hypothetical protein
MALFAITVGCSDDGVQNDIDNTVEIDAQMMEKYLDPLMNYDIRDHNPDYRSTLTSARGKDVTKKLKVRQSGIMTPIFGYEGCLPEEAFIIIEGTGNGTHLGLHGIDISYCTTDPLGLTSPYQIYGYLTAANGDVVNGMLVGASEDPDLEIIIQEWEFYDGTGRFEGASGGVTLYVSFNFDNFTWSNTGVGTITY